MESIVVFTSMILFDAGWRMGVIGGVIRVSQAAFLSSHPETTIAEVYGREKS